ncbi:MAG: hypothetical protein KGI33_11650 [Thaumarchaeota archaeon]|nr:hypothetical protein [Nitrososphaerota archaeon]
MKTLHLAIIVGTASIAIIIGVLTFELNQKTPVNIDQTNQTNIPPSVSNIVIPAGSEDPSSGKIFEPQYLVVVLGVNNTVKWTNESPEAASTIVAESQDDPLFWNATRLGHDSQLLPGQSFNFTFTKVGEFRYGTEPHPWLAGWIVVLPQSAQNAIQTVTLNASSGISEPCATFTMPCPNYPPNHNFTAQRFGSNIYIEKVTANGVDNYAIMRPDTTCYYPSGQRNPCTNPDELAILRLVGVDTSIQQEYADIVISGLKSKYAAGEPISFELRMNGYGYDACEIPYVSVFGQNGSLVWQSNKTPWISCIPGRGYHDTVFGMNTLGGPFSINQSGTYTIHVDYALNSTYEQFEVVPPLLLHQAGHVAYTRGDDPFGIIALVVYHPPAACLGPCPPNTFYLKINSATAAYLQGYNICDGNSCTAGNDLAVSLPINDILRPDFAMVPLPTDLKWKYGDTVRIQVFVSSTAENKNASLVDYGNSTIVP